MRFSRTLLAVATLPHKGNIWSLALLFESATLVCTRVAVLFWLLFPSPSPAECLKIHLAEDGPYHLGFQQIFLGEMGPAWEIPSQALHLSRRGQGLPLWVEDGGDGLFGPGDHLEWLGEHRQGHNSRVHEQGLLMTDWLCWSSEKPAPQLSPAVPVSHTMVACSEDQVSRPSEQWLGRAWLEEDVLPMLSTRSFSMDSEFWYWKVMDHLAQRPLEISLENALKPASERHPLKIRLRFHGISALPLARKQGQSDHAVQVFWAGNLLKTLEWDGALPHEEEILLPPEEWSTQPRQLGLQVLRRTQISTKRDLVDVIWLNSVELQFVQNSWPGSEARLFESRLPVREKSLSLEGAPKNLVLLGEKGSRVQLEGCGNASPSSHWTWEARDTEENFWLVPGEQAWKTPVALEWEELSAWKSTEHQADYLMIGPRGLLDAVEPLAEFHRSWGLKVELIELRELYDEFSHGLQEPRALRRFLEWAQEYWKKPAPRFVLLVGDASWGARQEEPIAWLQAQGAKLFQVQNKASSSSESSDIHNLVPTFHSPDYPLYVIGDQEWVDFGARPRMAIGRFPFSTAEEVGSAVEKSLRFMRQVQEGRIPEKILWISGEDRESLLITEAMHQKAEALHYTSIFFQNPGEQAKPEQRSLVEELSQSLFLVHFVGHGGRHVWRTAAPEAAEGRTLFQLADLPHLANQSSFPILLSLSCNSAPFDHPRADSLGELALRLPEAGAVAVFASSSRNQPFLEHSQILLEEITRGGTLGEAIQRAKERVDLPIFSQSYNLLGDPALILPAGPVSGAAKAP